MTGPTGARLRTRALTGLAVLTAALTLTGTVAIGAATADPDETATTVETTTTTVETTTELPPTGSSDPTGTSDPTETSESTGSTDPTETSVPTETTESTTESTTEPGPAAGDEDVQLEAEVAFDKPSYQTGDPIHLTLTIRNNGDTTVGPLQAYSGWDSPDAFIPDSPMQWGVFQYPGIMLAPGEARSVDLSGKARRISSTRVVFDLMIFEPLSGTFYTASFDAPIELHTGPVAGLVFGDRNGNGTADPGEGLPGVEAQLYYQPDGTFWKAKSDATGRFDFGRVPVAHYSLTVGMTVGDFNFRYQEFDVAESGRTDLVMRGTLPYNGRLSASMAFTKDTYQVGETVHITVSLTNHGSTPFTGLVAGCNRGGFDQSLYGTAPGWGDLRTGVNLAPGETKVFDVTDTVPQEAFNVGYVGVGCDFGLGEDDIDDHAFAGDQALVPGGFGTLRGDVTTGPDHTGVAGVRLVLTNPDSPCPMAVEATTDADGNFVFANVPAWPNYLVYVVPPAGMKVRWDDNPTRVVVRAGDDQYGRWGIELEEGTADVPEPPPPASGCPDTPVATGSGPAPSGSAPQAKAAGAEELAYTGASVVGLAAFGLVALVGGALAVLGVRRRRSAA